MSIQGTDLIKEMEKYAPKSFAMDKDPVGLQIGDERSNVNGVLVTLDVTLDVVYEAIEKGFNWIIAHHPVIFKPIKELKVDEPSGKLLSTLLKHDISVYVAHTNLDIAPNGVNDVLCEKLGIVHSVPLIPQNEVKLKKLVVFVPGSHHQVVLESIFKAGAGWIGNYSSCSYNIEGTGTFFPQEGTNPFIGSTGELEKVSEIRIETIFKDVDQECVINAMKKAHPYEEVAYDIYPLDQKGEVFGLGNIGNLPEIKTLRELTQEVKTSYRVDGLRVVGDPDKKVEKVAILGGSGGKFFKDAVLKGADVYITGDVDYHVAQDALSLGLAMIDPGHHIEHFVVSRVSHILKNQFQDKISVYESQVNTNPFRFE